MTRNFGKTLYSHFGEPLRTSFFQNEGKELVDRNNAAMLDLIRELVLRNASNSIVFPMLPKE